MSLDKYIQIFEAPLPYVIVSKILKNISSFKDDFNKATVVGDSENQGINKERNIRRTDVLQLDPSSKSLSQVHIYNILYRLFLNCSFQYTNICKTEHTCNFINDISILRYTKGFFYQPHVDHCGSIPRTMSFIYLLNDDYKGGKLNFYSPDKKEITKTVDVKGNRLIAWPSNFLYPHGVEPVEEGTRYSIVCWAL
jgi:Rps23 Pro-64 3,4-dihydroxylase Tpa1-like proline 4-hydroxylase